MKTVSSIDLFVQSFILFPMGSTLILVLFTGHLREDFDLIATYTAMGIVPWQLVSAIIIGTQPALRRFRIIHLTGWGAFVVIIVLIKVFYEFISEYSRDLAPAFTIGMLSILTIFYYYITIQTFVVYRLKIRSELLK